MSSSDTDDYNDNNYGQFDPDTQKPPSAAPTVSSVPTTAFPSSKPTPGPTSIQTLAPTSVAPTIMPSPAPTVIPIPQPTPLPTVTPYPTAEDYTRAPTPKPTNVPIPVPTPNPTTPAPSQVPTPVPTPYPTPAPSELVKMVSTVYEYGNPNLNDEYYSWATAAVTKPDSASFDLILINVERRTQYYSAYVTLESEDLISADVSTNITCTDRQGAEMGSSGELASGEFMCVPMISCGPARPRADRFGRDKSDTPRPCPEQVRGI